MSGQHGLSSLTDFEPRPTGDRSLHRFAELFPSLPPLLSDRENIEDLGRTGGPVYDAEDEANCSGEESDRIPAAYTFYGQFVDHDITLDVQTSLDRHADATDVENIRSPSLGLDSVYGHGPEASRHLYDSESHEGEKLLHSADGRDVARNRQGTALIGDPRNDENLIVSQIQLAFIKLHNAAFDHFRREDHDEPFEAARQLVRWTHQWLVINEFLPLTVGQDLVDDIFDEGPRYYPMRTRPFIPVEFAAAAYRFGHSQVRIQYKVNDDRGPQVFFKLRDDTGIDVTPPDVEWEFLFSGDYGWNSEIDTNLANPLGTLPGMPDTDEQNSLASRNLERGLTYLLPSGEELARRMGYDPIDIRSYRLQTDETPAWLYILEEAERQETDRLGPVGGRIVAETLFGLIANDPTSYLNNEPEFEPEFLETCRLDEDREFVLQDLLEEAHPAGEAGTDLDF